MSFTLNTLTEGIRQRHMGAQHKRLTEKWNRTGLLRGLQGYNRENMAVLLENQAAQLLRETNTLGSAGSAGDIRGFQNVAFPIVRRVFGGLVANELVSVQPMSLPSGLLFYLDYTYGTAVGGDDGASNNASTYTAGQSIYNNPVGKGVQSGSLATGGHYDLLGSGYSREHGTTADLTVTTSSAGVAAVNISTTGVITWPTAAPDSYSATELVDAVGRLVDFDADLQTKMTLGEFGELVFVLADLSDITVGNWASDRSMIQDYALSSTDGSAIAATALAVIPSHMQPGTNLLNLRRHTKLVRLAADNRLIVDPLAATHVLFVCQKGSGTLATLEDDVVQISFAKASNFDSDSSVADALTIPTFESTMAVSDGEGNPAAPIIPEIDIKIESLSVTAVSRKLKARWSPELAQDLNAYHSLDAEAELTQILSEQIALELDREILNDLLTQANGANLFWSRAPGRFVNKLTGTEITRDTRASQSFQPGPAFTGTVQDWYSTLVETIIDAANIIHRKTLRGSANFIVVGPDVATVLEASVAYKPTYSLDANGQVGAGMTIGAEKAGSLSNRFTVYKDPYFPRNKILIGYKGGNYLETGYVYAPYVPLIVTPTIFAPEDFTPRRGVMTRYGKKMVRSDFYGTVTCLDMHII